jgi:hypothetical protein
MSMALTSSVGGDIIYLFNIPILFVLSAKTKKSHKIDTVYIVNDN